MTILNDRSWLYILFKLISFCFLCFIETYHDTKVNNSNLLFLMIPSKRTHQTRCSVVLSLSSCTPTHVYVIVFVNSWVTTPHAFRQSTDWRLQHKFNSAGYMEYGWSNLLSKCISKIYLLWYLASVTALKNDCFPCRALVLNHAIRADDGGAFVPDCVSERGDNSSHWITVSGSICCSRSISSITLWNASEPFGNEGSLSNSITILVSNKSL